jgi:hypothetical protein
MLVFALAWMTGCESGGKVFSRPRQLTLRDELERLVFLSGLLEHLSHAILRVEVVRVILDNYDQPSTTHTEGPSIETALPHSSASRACFLLPIS